MVLGAFRPSIGALSLTCTLCLGACSSRTSFEPLPSPDTRAVVAVEFEGTTPERTSLHLRRSTGSIEIEIEEGRDLALFFLDEGEFIGPEGSPLSDETWAALSVSGADAPIHGCGRCLVPSERGPFTVQAGDSCSLAESVPDALVLQTDERRTDELIAAARAFARLDWPGQDDSGDCACAPPRPTNEGLEACAIGGVPDAITPTWLAFDAEEQLIGLSPSHMFRLDPSGSRAVRLPKDLGAIQFIEPLPNGDWLIAQSTRLAMIDLEELVQLYSSDLERKVLRGIPHDRVRSAFATEDGKWLLGGYDIASLPGRFGPRIDECTPFVRPDGVTELACRILDLPEGPCFIESAGGSGSIEVIVPSSAGLLAFTGLGELFYRPTGEEAFRCVTRVTGTDGTWPFGQGVPGEVRLGAAIVVGDRIHLFLRDGGTNALIVSAPASREALDGSLGPLEWTLAAEVEYGLSAALYGEIFAFTLPSEPTQGFFRMTDYEVNEVIYAVNQDGQLAGEWRNTNRGTALALLYPELQSSKQARTIVSSSAGRVAVLGDDQLVHLQVDGGTFSRIGTEEPSFFPVEVAVTLPDGLQLALGSTRAFSLDDDEARCEGGSLRPWPVDFSLPGPVKLATAQLGFTRRVLVHGDEWTGSLDLESGAFDRRTELDGVALRGLTSLAPNIAVVLTLNGDARFIGLEGQSVETPAGLNEEAWLSASGANGVVWLAGWTRLARLRNGPSGPIVETDWLDQLEPLVPMHEVPPIPVSLGSIDARCPSDVAMWGEDVSGRETVLRVFQIHADPRALFLSMLPLDTTDFEILPVDPNEPIIMSSVDRRSIALSRRGFIATGEHTRLAMPFRALSSVAAGTARALVIGEPTALGARVGFLHRRSP